MWRIGTFVDQWLLSARSIRVGSKRRPPRRPPIGKRPELEPVEGRILLSAADVAMIRATPVEAHQLARSPVQITEVRGIGHRNRRAELTATLTSGGQPVVGQMVTFRLGHRIVGRARTDSNGVATLTNAKFGHLKFRDYLAKTVVVFRGNANLKPAVQRGPLTVSQATSVLSGVTASGVYGGRATFSAALSSNGAAAPGKAVSFVLGGRTVGTATTDAKGVATLSGVGLAGLNAGTYGITATFAGDAESPQASATGSLTVARAAASITLGGLSQTYGGTGQVTATASPAGLRITLSYMDASGNAVARPVRAGTYGVTATIADGNYSGTAVGTLVISPAVVSVSGIDAMSKTYDGSATATIDAGNALLAGVAAGDSVAIDTSHASASFDGAGVGMNRPVAISGLVLTGPDASNYVLSHAATIALAAITPKPLTVSGIAASDKAYDGTTTATIDDSAAALIGVVAGDDVAIDDSAASAAFADKNVGDAKLITVSGLTLTGTAASNYTLTAPGLTADITPRRLTLDTSSLPASKQYDGTTTAPAPASPSLSGVIAGESVEIDTSGVTGYTLAAKDVGVQVATAEGLALSGDDAGNYTIDPTYQVIVTPALILVSGVTANGRTYDGTTVTSIDFGGASFTGVLFGDDVMIDDSAAIGRFADKNVGVGKAVAIEGLAKSGADAGNYIFQFSTGVTADITPKAVHANGFTATDRTYDGTVDVTVAAGTISLEAGDVVVGDDIAFDASTAGSGVGVMADANAGAGKTVTITGLGLVGADAGNYTIVATTTVDIARATITLSGVTASKVYDGTTAVTVDATGALISGVIGSDDVTLDPSTGTGSFADRNVGAGKALTVVGFNLAGVDAANYTLAIAPLTGNIDSRVLHVEGFTATDRTYDGTSTVSVGGAEISFGAGDLAAGDDVSLDSSSLASAVGTMADKNAGNGKAVTISGLAITGADAGNYTIVATTTVNITGATLTVTGIPDLTKPYDGNQYFTSIDSSGASLDGVLGSDIVTLNTAGVFGVSTSANVGTWSVFINGLALGGTDSGNYNLGAVIVSGTIVGP